jgi:hypothetical protein
MALIGAVGGLAFVLVSLVVGLRMVLLSRRTGGLPELTIGLALFLMGGCGYPLTAAARLAPLSDPARSALFLVSMLLALIGIISTCTFNWRVFRPDARWAALLVGAVATSQAACIVAQCVSPGLLAGARYNQGMGLKLFTAQHAIPLAWAAFESLRYATMLSRRVKLGLGDPIVADRMRLWATAMLAALAINVASTTAAFQGIDFAASASGALIIAPLGLLAASCVCLAFWPPKAYLRRVAARAAVS